MIKEIRDYFRLIIKQIDSELIENPSAFYDGDIGETIIDRSYQIELNNISSDYKAEYRMDSMNATVIIFGFGNRDEIANYDDLLDKALCIRDSIIELKNIGNADYITNITANTITSEKLPSDDSAFRININFTLETAYSRG
jgi:hypothetical protein